MTNANDAKHEKNSDTGSGARAANQVFKGVFQQDKVDIGLLLNAGQRAENHSRRVLDEAQRRQAHDWTQSGA